MGVDLLRVKDTRRLECMIAKPQVRDSHWHRLAGKVENNVEAVPPKRIGTMPTGKGPESSLSLGSGP
jgi:hypothetical protein